MFVGALEGAESSAVPWHVARVGDSLNLDGMALRVLWPPGEEAPGGQGNGSGGGSETPGIAARRALAARGPNEASVVLELRFGEFSLLLTGDAPSEVEEAILPSLISPRVQLLKVGHHGSLTSTSPELLERLSPEVALVSVGRRNRYGHPHPSVLQRLEASGAEILRTDEQGTVIITARRDGLFRVHRLTPD